MLRFAPAVFAVGRNYHIMAPVSGNSLFWVRVGDQCYYDGSNGVMRSGCSVHRAVVPMSALDADIKVVLRAQLKEIQKKLRITMIYVTHDQEEAFALSDRIMVLNDLRIAQLDTPYELYHHPADPFVKRFIADHLNMKVKSIEDCIKEVHP